MSDIEWLIGGLCIGLVIYHLYSPKRHDSSVDPSRVLDALRDAKPVAPVQLETPKQADRHQEQAFVDHDTHRQEVGDRFAQGSIEQTQKEFMEWLAQQTPDTWHAIACTWNWSYDGAPLLWIVSQSQCDFGTAHHIFFAQAANWRKYQRWEELDYSAPQTSWKTCKLIADRWARQDFVSAELKSDGYSNAQKYRNQEKRAQDAGEALAWSVPDYVYSHRGTREPHSDYAWMDGGFMFTYEAWKRQHDG